ncbi:ABC transporter substrate-binding protein [Lichenifustis flavocetrariae]|uniref:Extracellular solute-binding protein n=1 Tax=Lichenifustis flavocetrariae TaxID=2949735 RepID=A0AA42CJN5_9HYPH|nr:extracellular solute-binding protein [Lichenifustis flavocetrariae]MCW6508281.1 extracellular solute-binding protein [Lichenifustis flavocetrariae]
MGDSRPHLRVLGTEITLIEPLRRMAEEELGLSLSFEVLDFMSAQRKAALEPDSFDIYDQCFHNLDIVWFWRAIQPIELARITRWPEMSPLTTQGRISPLASFGRGENPVRMLYVQPDLSLAERETSRISMLPTVHNLDAFAYAPDLFASRAVDEVSWAWLFDPEVKGRLFLVDEPGIGVFDAALAFEARGEIGFQDIGNMTIAEIDALMALLWARRKEGMFAGLWQTAQQAADAMLAGRAGIGSMWSPGAARLRQAGRAVIEAVPREGYRAWHSGMCLSSRLSGPLLDAAYRYLNWWLDGQPGALLARQGFYMSVPGPVRNAMMPAEWDYWYGGKAASVDISGIDGRPMVAAGTSRPGGSYWQRAEHINVWNTTMDEYNYLARHWSQFAETFA